VNFALRQNRSVVRENNSKILDVFGRDLLGMPEVERKKWISQAAQYWRSVGFPFPALTKEIAQRELGLLQKVGASSLRHVLAKPSTVGLRLANSFHPQMWEACIRGRSPVECFENDPILLGSLGKAPAFWPDRRCWNARAIRILMSIQNRSRVSNFRPTVARALIDTFTSSEGSVLDFSAGYGGRLLGAATLERSYTGIDPATKQHAGLVKMANYLRAKANLINGCAEDVLPTLRKKFDVVFTSPPYFRLERYSPEPSQSFRKYPSYEDWIHGFLRPSIENSHRLLKRDGFLILNVANISTHNVADDADLIAKTTFGGRERTVTMCMSSNPADKARRGKYLRSEPVFIYRKR
jgi:tRNA1(Val) A37 N6-methylase TrmN6